MSKQEQKEENYSSPLDNINNNKNQRYRLSQKRRREYNDLKIISRFEEEKLKDRIDMMSPQIKKGQQPLIDQNEILENAKDKNSPAKLIRMSTTFEVEKANKYCGNLAKRAAQSVLMQSEFGISDIDESRLVPQRNISNDYNPQLYNGNRSQLRTPSISVDRSEKSPSPRNRVGRSPILSKLYDNTRLIPNNLGKVGVKQMNATDKRLMFQNNHNHPKSMMSNLSHRSLRSNAVDQERNQSDIIQATHDLLFQGLTPNQKLIGQRDAQRASFLKPKAQKSSNNHLNYQNNNNQTDESSSNQLSRYQVTNNKDVTIDNILPSIPQFDHRNRDISRDTQFINTTNNNGFMNTYTDQTLDIQTPAQNTRNSRRRGDSILSKFVDPSYVKKQEELERRDMRVLITKENVDFAMRRLHKRSSQRAKRKIFFKKIAQSLKLGCGFVQKIRLINQEYLERICSPFKKAHKKWKSLRSLFGSSKKQKQEKRRSSLKRNSKGISIENLSAKSEEDQNEMNLKKKGSLSQTTIEYQNEQPHHDDEVNEAQIRKINQDRARSQGLMYPDSQLRGFIDGISFILLLLISVYIPFIIAFNVDTSGPFDYFELFIDIWFLIEIMANFITGYYDKGILIMDRKMIFLTYLQGWFFIDILSSAPILVISIANQDESSNFQAVRSTKLIRMLRFARYARLLRLIKFLRLNKYLQPVEELIVSDYAHLGVRFLKISCAVIFITHWAACMMYSVGISEFESQGKNWLQLQQLNDASVGEQYINSLYWASTTMCTVGYGDFHPATSYERVVSMIVMIMSSGVFAFIIGDIGRMVSGFNLLADQFREKMIYVDRFLTQKSIPLNLRVQVKRYLEYNWQLKKIYKIEEQDLLSLLNENLRGKITVYFNGRILQSIDVLCKFPIEFLSNLSFLMRKQTYSIDDNLIIEKGQGGELFYMQNGRVSAIHMKTKTHLTDLEKDRYFGEIAFFTSLTRQATIKARDFTEVLIINREDFLQMLLKESFRDSLLLFHKIRDTITEKSRDFRILSIRCYICYSQGHIAIHCKQFQRYKGNLKRYYKKIYKQSFESSSESFEETKQNPVVNTEDSYLKKKSKLQRQRSRAYRRRQLSHQTPQKKIISDNQLQTSQVFGSINNDISFPEEKIENPGNFDMPLFSEKQLSLKRQVSPDVDQIRVQQFNKTPSFALSLLSAYGSKQDQNNSDLEDLQQYESESMGEQIQMIHFDTPPKEEQQVTPSYRYQQRKSVKKRRKSQKSGIRDVIQEELQEDESSSMKSISVSNSEDESSQFNISRQEQSDELDDMEEEKAPLLSQSTSQQFPGAPKAINELTKLVGRKKRFKSKNLREDEKQKLRQSIETRRKIHIRPMNEIQKEIKTIVQKTFTTMVETITKEEKYRISPSSRLETLSRKKNSDQKANSKNGAIIVSNNEESKSNILSRQDKINTFGQSPIKTSSEEAITKKKRTLVHKDKKKSGSINDSLKGSERMKNNRYERKKGLLLTNMSQLQSENSDINIFENNDQNWPSYRKNMNGDSSQSQKHPLNTYSFKQDSGNETKQSGRFKMNKNEDLILKQTSYLKQEDKKNQLFINQSNLQLYNEEQSSVLEQWNENQQKIEEFKKD